MRILFQGDSITDAGRNRLVKRSNEGLGLGNGYVSLTSAELLALDLNNEYEIYSR